MNLRINGLTTCSFNNGDGCRYVIFVQGCLHHCPGCQNPDTWDINGGMDIDVKALACSIKNLFIRHPLDGITLSGGDPYYQQEALIELIKQLGPALNVWCYTGFEWEDIASEPLTEYCDTVVVGPYIQDLRCEGVMYGSSNQKIIRRTKTWEEV